MPKDVTKTCKIAKVRILVEQVIRQMKTFRLIANELPLSLVPQANDILVVCAALTNLTHDPIYKDQTCTSLVCLLPCTFGQPSCMLLIINTACLKRTVVFNKASTFYSKRKLKHSHRLLTIKFHFKI